MRSPKCNRAFLGFLILSLLSLLSAQELWTQDRSRDSSISGRIVDASNGQPIENVSVFLDNTTLGDASDKDGNFLIPRIPPGIHTLVVSMIGYGVQKATFELRSKKEIVRNFRLRSTNFQLRPLEISAETARDWQKNLRRFERLFLGSSRFARECEILNPQYLDFTRSSTGAFYARAEAPIEIENPALGYRIRFILENFRSHDKDFSIYGQAQFIPSVPRDEEEWARWQKNREMTYLGSLRHFLASVIEDKSEREGFVVYLPLETTLNNKSDITGLVTDKPIKVKQGPLPNERILSFSKSLKVEYTHNKNQDDYKGGGKQISWLALADTATIVDISGNALYPENLKQFGNWASNRIGDLLPRDYQLGGLGTSGLTPATDSLGTLILSKRLDEVEADLVVSVLDELAFKNSLNDVVISQLHADIKDIMSPADHEKWKQLENSVQKGSFLRGFWLFRDMSFGTRKNERLEEHYERLKHARTFYTASESRGYDDRGQTYIKYGEPTMKQADTMPLYKQMNSVGDFRMAAGKSLETWIYQRGSKQVVYNFVDKIWGFSQVHTIHDFLPSHLDVREREIILSDVLRRRVDLDVGFASLYAQSETMTQSEFESSFDRVLNEQVYEQTQLPPAISLEFEDVYELPFAFRPALFENSSNEHTLILTYGLHKNDIRSLQSKAQGTDQLKLLSVIRNANLVDIALGERTVPLKESEFDVHGEMIYQLQVPIAENYFFVLADISNAAGNQRGFADYTVRNPVFSDHQLHLSSVVFAHDITPVDSATPSDSVALIRNGLNIKVNPFTELRASDPHFLYFEIYGLQRGVSAKTDYEVEYTVEPVAKKGLSKLLGKINPFKGGGSKISVITSQSGDESRDFVFTSLDFKQLPLGEQKLIVRIKDKVANATIEKTSTFVLK